MSKHFKRGFTLIELLVVIAIIGILASIILVSLNSARAKGRDAARISSLQEMGKAISLADTGTNVALTGCVSGGVMASTCTGPSPISFSNYLDPTTPATVCTKTSAATCQYMVAPQAGGAGAPGTENYEICTYLESGTAQFAGGSAGTYIVSVSSNSSASVAVGCN